MGRNRPRRAALDRSGRAMKAGREHRVPLSARRWRSSSGWRPSGWASMFPGVRSGRPLSNMALLMTLRRIGRGDLTAHGFRARFRDWTASEPLLGRSRRNGPGARRRRQGGSGLPARRPFEKRRQLAEAWAKFTVAPAADGRQSCRSGVRRDWLVFDAVVVTLCATTSLLSRPEEIVFEKPPDDFDEQRWSS